MIAHRSAQCILLYKFQGKKGGGGGGGGGGLKMVIELKKTMQKWQVHVFVPYTTWYSHILPCKKFVSGASCSRPAYKVQAFLPVNKLFACRLPSLQRTWSHCGPSITDLNPFTYSLKLIICVCTYQGSSQKFWKGGAGHLRTCVQPCFYNHTPIKNDNKRIFSHQSC